MEQPQSPQPLLRVAIAGNPNAGKSSIFNRLTGLRQKVGNYPGVTVERKIGRCQIDDLPVELVDLPGAYSLTVSSPDEEIARDVLFGWMPEQEPAPDVVLVVVDATSLQRNLFLATQIIELGYPTVIALNMADLAAAEGLTIDPDELGRRLGVPVVPTVASRGVGLDKLKATIVDTAASDLHVPMAEPLQRQVDALAEDLIGTHDVAPSLAPAMALRLISSPAGLAMAADHYSAELASRLSDARAALAEAGVQWQGCEAGSRYPWLAELVAESTARADGARPRTFSEKLDRVLTHRFLGPVIFFLLMALVFQTIYTWATPFMDAIDAGTAAVGGFVSGVMPEGILSDLLVDGVIAGVGSVIIFLPQIVFLFLFLALLEDTGYMARAAFVMDRIMSRVGLHGRSFVPLLSSFACAIPGIMAARTIGTKRDRLTTILVAPLITCPARLPVYALLIAAFVPQRAVLGIFSLQALSLLSLYLLGVFGALGMAAVLKRTILRGPTPALVLELPAYRAPSLRQMMHDLWERAWLFLRFAGSVILSLSIVLWFLAYFPRTDTSGAETLARQQMIANGEDAGDAELLAARTEHMAGEIQLENSLMGRLGKVVEPLVRPLGFDWRIGVGLVSSFAAREVMVSTMGIIFAVGDEVDEGDETLIGRLRSATRPNGEPLFTLPVVASLLVFFVFAMQCMSTLGIAVRETGGWKWPAFMVAYMTVLAYSASFVTYHGMRWAGWG